MADTAEKSGPAVLEPLGHLGPAATLVQAFQSTAAERPEEVAHGDRRPYTVALLVLDPDGARAWAAAHGRPDADCAALTADQELYA
jgi:hypothetical protein